jgi:hypothetical protein
MRSSAPEDQKEGNGDTDVAPVTGFAGVRRPTVRTAPGAAMRGDEAESELRALMGEKLARVSAGRLATVRLKRREFMDGKDISGRRKLAIVD